MERSEANHNRADESEASKTKCADVETNGVEKQQQQNGEKQNERTCSKEDTVAETQQELVATKDEAVKNTESLLDLKRIFVLF